MKKTVVVVNGKPRAGKDSTIAAMAQILNASGIAVHAFSSIDPIRDMLSNAGFDLASKTPADRALMAEVGDSVEKHSEWRSQRSFLEIAGFFNDVGDDKPAVMFLHVREPHIIDRIAARVARRGWSMMKVIVRSKRAEHVTSNAADLGVDDIEYDAEIANNGTLDDLAKKADQLLFKNGLIQQLSLLH